MDNENNTRLIFLFILLSLCLITTLIFIIFSSVNNPIYIESKIRNNINFLLPQGWAFFTRDAREEKVIIYKVSKSGKSLDKITAPASSLQYAMGLDRIARKIPSELAALTREVEQNSWVAFSGNIDSLFIVSKPVKPLRIVNKSRSNHLCGELVITKVEIIPWSWSSFKDVALPGKFLKIHVACNGK